MRIVNSIYVKRLLALCLLLCTVPVLTLGIFSYFKSSEIIQKKVNEANIQLLSQTQMRVEEILRYTGNYYTVFADSQLAALWMQKTMDYREIDSILELQKALNGLQKLQTAIKSAYFINVGRDWVIGSDVAGTLYNKKNKSQILEIMTDPRTIFWKYIKPMSDSERSNLDEMVELGPISLVIRIPFNQGIPTNAIIINLSYYEFDKMLRAGEGVGTLFILDENYTVLYHDDEAMIGKDFSPEPYIAELRVRGQAYGIYKTKIDGREVGISYKKSEYNRWTYVSVYSIGEITSDSRSIGWATFFICSFTLLLLLAMSVFGTKVMYSPVRNIYDIMVKSMNTAEHGHDKTDELKSIGEGIHTLMLSKTKMEEEIKNQKLQLEELFFSKLIRGELKQEEIELKLQSMDRRFEWRWLGLAALQIDCVETEEDGKSDSDVVMLAIGRIISGLAVPGLGFRPMIIKQTQVVLIGGDHEELDEFKNYVYSCTELLQKNVKENLNTRVSIGISRTFKKLSEVQIAFMECMEALMGRFRLGEQVILFFEDVQPENFIRQPYPKKLERDLTEAINAGDSGGAETILHAIVDAFFYKELSINEYHIYLNRLLIGILRILEDSGESFNAFFCGKRLLFEEMMNLQNAEEIKKWFKESIITPVITMLEERRANRHKRIVDEITRIIREEYDTDLTLEECAARLSYHPSYIWRIFRATMGMGFSDYLAQYRLKIVKQWLEETDMSIVEISERLKYNNPQNFIRYFKKHEGITPGQYRESRRLKV